MPSQHTLAVSTVTGRLSTISIACDYSGATIFQASSFTGATPGTILHAQAALTGTSPGNAAAALQIGPNGNGKDGFPLPALSLNGSVAKLRATRWYVGCNGRFACDQPGGRSLFQSSLRNNPAGTLGVASDEISDGVSAMSFQYLTPGAAAYVNAAGVTNWANVSAVKVLLTTIGQDRVGTDGAPISRQVEHVISLRNHLP